MRRRIYIDPEGDLSDCTERPYTLDDSHLPSAGFEICDVGALYDGDLWERYQAACDEVRRLRSAVCCALINEPFDEVEKAAHEEDRAIALDDPDAQVKYQAIEARLRANALAKVTP